MNKKFISLLLVAVLAVATLSGCKLIGKDKGTKTAKKETSEKVETKNVEESKSDTTGKPTTWQLDEEISIEAAKMMAEKEGININKDELLTMYRDNYANGEAPKTKTDLQYSLNAIEKIVGEENIIKKILPQYVISKVKEKKSEELEDISKEELNQLLEDYKEYMDTMGIVESAREEYVKNLYLKSELELKVDGLYQQCYDEAAYRVFSKYNPEYMKSLNLSD